MAWMIAYEKRPIEAFFKAIWSKILNWKCIADEKETITDVCLNEKENLYDICSILMAKIKINSWKVTTQEILSYMNLPYNSNRDRVDVEMLF